MMALAIQDTLQRLAIHIRLIEVMRLIEQVTSAAEYVPGPEGKADLDRALALLLREYGRRGFEPGEKAEWNCRGLVIGGEAKGDWRITLQRTDGGDQA